LLDRTGISLSELSTRDIWQQIEVEGDEQDEANGLGYTSGSSGVLMGMW